MLVEIDPADYEVAVAQARAEYADAQAQASAAGINVPDHRREHVEPGERRPGGSFQCEGWNRRCPPAIRSRQVAGRRSGGQQRQSAERSRPLQATDRQAGNLAAAVRSGRCQRHRPLPRPCKRRAPAPTLTRRRSNRRRANCSRPTPICAPPAPRRRRCESCARARFPRRPSPIERRPNSTRPN